MTDDREKTVIQLNEVITLALAGNNPDAAVSALSMKVELMEDLRRNPAKRPSPSISAFGASLGEAMAESARKVIGSEFSMHCGRSASDILDGLTASICSAKVPTAIFERTTDGKIYQSGFSIGVDLARGPDKTVRSIDVPGADGGSMIIRSDRTLADGTPLWTITKSGIRFQIEVANATHRPDLDTAA